MSTAEALAGARARLLAASAGPPVPVHPSTVERAHLRVEARSVGRQMGRACRGTPALTGLVMHGDLLLDVLHQEVRRAY